MIVEGMWGGGLSGVSGGLDSLVKGIGEGVQNVNLRIEKMFSLRFLLRLHKLVN